MDSVRWTRVREVLEEALQRPAGERAAFVDEACAGESTLAEEVRALLAAEDPADVWPAPLEAAPAGTAPPRRAGPWELLEEIGAGGMGTVHRARRADRSFEKEVALKLLRPGLDTSELQARFRQERQVLAGLEHPGIARLIDGGSTEEGLPYLVMEFVEGTDIHRFCDEQRLPVRARLELFLEVCEAVQYAHQQLVVHRDLKPSNVLVGADGRPKLLDFGIAKLLEAAPAESEATRELRLMTPEYASPEQVRGEPITTASDVYSLGAVLYRLLTGSLAHRITGPTPSDAERAICIDEPTPPSAAVLAEGRAEAPRELARVLAGDLDTIVLKALQKDRARRYGSVEQLADDVRRYLAGLPVTARPDSALYRARLFVRRNALPVGLVAALFAVLAGATWLSLGYAADARRARDATAAERDRVRELFDLYFERGVTSVAEFAPRILELSGGTSLAVEYMDSAVAELDALAGQAEGDARIRALVAEAYQRLADVTGSFVSVPTLSDPELALEHYDRAHAAASMALAVDPANARARTVLARVETGRAMTAHANGEGAAAKAGLLRAREVYTGLFEEAPESDDAASNLAHVEGCLAQVVKDVDGAEAAREHVLAEMELARLLADRHPDDKSSLLVYANALCNLGFSDYLSSDYELSLEHYQTCRELLGPWAEAQPDDLHLARQLAWSTLWAAIVKNQLERVDEAFADFAVAQNALDRLADRNPRDRMIIWQQSGCLDAAATAHKSAAERSREPAERAEHVAAARDLYRRAISILERYEAEVGLSPSDHGFLDRVRGGLESLAALDVE